MASKEHAPSPWRPGMPLPGRSYTAAEVTAPWEKGGSYEHISPKGWYLLLRDEISEENLEKLRISVNSAARDGAITEGEAESLRESIQRLRELMSYAPRRK